MGLYYLILLIKEANVSHFISFGIKLHIIGPKYRIELDPSKTVKLIDVFKSNGYPENFINNSLKCFWISNIENKKK